MTSLTAPTNTMPRKRLGRACYRYECQVRILMIGESGVGKSSLLVRYSENQFRASYMATIGLDFMCKNVKLPGYEKPVQVQLWDTAGQERFQVITKAYYRGAHGIVLTYDVTDERSFIRVNHWMGQIARLARKGVLVYLMANKADKVDQRVISQEEGKILAAKHGIPFYECSAKSGEGVTEAFKSISKQTAHKALKENDKLLKKGNSIIVHDGQQAKRKCPGCVLM